jgi:hypothetical protein
MACKDCTGKYQGRCDCCYIVDGIDTIKEVVYCNTCDAFICKPCQNNWIKRSIAYLFKKLTPRGIAATQPIIEETSIDQFQQLEPEQIVIESESLNNEEA